TGFEEDLVKRLQSLAPDWSFTVQTLERSRDFWLRLQLAPLMVGGVIAGFLVLMVGLGLTGILWQSVTRRTSELGLRRAVGASAREIHLQILTEVLILVSLGIGLALLLVVQIPIFGWLQFLGPSTIPLGVIAAASMIYLITTLCALYPSILASRIQPAEALHYE
ncbi:MAG TPA: FtsX-like permease family protein, partial [Thermoanaerobaculia bacterium]|nr:FtsX-like permease family protein [Thermoanaerobaculia bacterium]